MQLQVIYCASNLSAFLKRSAVLYLSSPLHCNHWFVPAGNYGWASYCMSFSGWILQVKSVFQSHYCFVFVSCCFHVKHRNTSFLTFLFLSLSIFLSLHSDSVLQNLLHYWPSIHLVQTNTDLSFLSPFFSKLQY